MGFGRQQMGGMYGGMPQYSGGISGKGGQQQTSGMIGERFNPIDRPSVFPRTQAPYQTPQSVFGILGRDTMGYGMPQGYGMNPYQSFQPRYSPYAGGMSGKGGQMGGNYMGGMGYRPQPNYYLSPFGGPFPLNQFHGYNPYAGSNYYSNMMGYRQPQNTQMFDEMSTAEVEPEVETPIVDNVLPPANENNAGATQQSSLTAEQLAALQQYFANNPFMFSGF